eukprot:m.14029 g.14029  ORF g.14029 m.14029 type:complete len:549 (-) comp4970_c0_seq1:8-1654(-)
MRVFSGIKRYSYAITPLRRLSLRNKAHFTVYSTTIKGRKDASSVLTTTITSMPTTITRRKKHSGGITSEDEQTLDLIEAELTNLRASASDEAVVLIQPLPTYKQKQAMRKQKAPYRHHSLACEEALRLVEAIMPPQEQKNEEKMMVDEVVFARMADKGVFGKGKTEELREVIQDVRARKNTDDVLVVVNIPGLSPSVRRALEEAWNCRILDRFGLILEVFRVHATTAEAKLQVELAQIPYLRGLLASGSAIPKGTLDKSGMRGQGETAFEKAKERLKFREALVQKNLEKVKAQRQNTSVRRLRQEIPVVALVGYTNAGKSELLSALTTHGQTEAISKDQLFHTLDTAARNCTLHKQQHCILIDTVGFITDLPHNLVSSFRATLDDISKATVIVHVMDAGNEEIAMQRREVLRVLKDELKVSQEKLDNMVEVLNKIDVVNETGAKVDVPLDDHSVVKISALYRQGLDKLRNVISHKIDSAFKRRTYQIDLPAGEFECFSWINAHTLVKHIRALDDGTNHVTFSMTDKTSGGFRKKFKHLQSSLKDMNAI